MSNTDNSTPRQIPLFQAGMRPRQWWGVNWYLMAALVGSCSVTELFSIGLKLWLVAVVCPAVFFLACGPCAPFRSRTRIFFTCIGGQRATAIITPRKHHCAPQRRLRGEVGSKNLCLEILRERSRTDSPKCFCPLA